MHSTGSVSYRVASSDGRVPDVARDPVAHAPGTVRPAKSSPSVWAKARSPRARGRNFRVFRFGIRAFGTGTGVAQMRCDGDAARRSRPRDGSDECDECDEKG